MISLMVVPAIWLLFGVPLVARWVREQRLANASDLARFQRARSALGQPRYVQQRQRRRTAPAFPAPQAYALGALTVLAGTLGQNVAVIAVGVLAINAGTVLLPGWERARRRARRVQADAGLNYWPEHVAVPTMSSHVPALRPVAPVQEPWPDLFERQRSGDMPTDEIGLLVA